MEDMYNPFESCEDEDPSFSFPEQGNGSRSDCAVASQNQSFDSSNDQNLREESFAGINCFNSPNIGFGRQPAGLAIENRYVPSNPFIGDGSRAMSLDAESRRNPHVANLRSAEQRGFVGRSQPDLTWLGGGRGPLEGAPIDCTNQFNDQHLNNFPLESEMSLMDNCALDMNTNRVQQSMRVLLEAAGSQGNFNSSSSMRSNWRTDCSGSVGVGANETFVRPLFGQSERFRPDAVMSNVQNREQSSRSLATANRPHEFDAGPMAGNFLNRQQEVFCGSAAGNNAQAFANAQMGLRQPTPRNEPFFSMSGLPLSRPNAPFLRSRNLPSSGAAFSQSSCSMNAPFLAMSGAQGSPGVVGCSRMAMPGARILSMLSPCSQALPNISQMGSPSAKFLPASTRPNQQKFFASPGSIPRLNPPRRMYGGIIPPNADLCRLPLRPFITGTTSTMPCVVPPCVAPLLVAPPVRPVPPRMPLFPIMGDGRQQCPLNELNTMVDHMPGSRTTVDPSRCATMNQPTDNLYSPTEVTEDAGDEDPFMPHTMGSLQSCLDANNDSATLKAECSAVVIANVESTLGHALGSCPVASNTLSVQNQAAALHRNTLMTEIGSFGTLTDFSKKDIASVSNASLSDTAAVKQGPANTDMLAPIDEQREIKVTAASSAFPNNDQQKFYPTIVPIESSAAIDDAESKNLSVVSKVNPPPTFTPSVSEIPLPSEFLLEEKSAQNRANMANLAQKNVISENSARQPKLDSEALQRLYLGPPVQYLVDLSALNEDEPEEAGGGNSGDDEPTIDVACAADDASGAISEAGKPAGGDEGGKEEEDIESYDVFDADDVEDVGSVKEDAESPVDSEVEDNLTAVKCREDVAVKNDAGPKPSEEEGDAIKSTQPKEKEIDLVSSDQNKSETETGDLEGDDGKGKADVSKTSDTVNDNDDDDDENDTSDDDDDDDSTSDDDSDDTTSSDDDGDKNIEIVIGGLGAPACPGDSATTRRILYESYNVAADDKMIPPEDSSALQRAKLAAGRGMSEEEEKLLRTRSSQLKSLRLRVENEARNEELCVETWPTSERVACVDASSIAPQIVPSQSGSEDCSWSSDPTNQKIGEQGKDEGAEKTKVVLKEIESSDVSDAFAKAVLGMEKIVGSVSGWKPDASGLDAGDYLKEKEKESTGGGALAVPRVIKLQRMDAGNSSLAADSKSTTTAVPEKLVNMGHSTSDKLTKAPENSETTDRSGKVGHGSDLAAGAIALDASVDMAKGTPVSENATSQSTEAMPEIRSKEKPAFNKPRFLERRKEPEPDAGIKYKSENRADGSAERGKGGERKKRSHSSHRKHKNDDKDSSSKNDAKGLRLRNDNSSSSSHGKSKEDRREKLPGSSKSVDMVDFGEADRRATHRSDATDVRDKAEKAEGHRDKSEGHRSKAAEDRGPLTSKTKADKASTDKSETKKERRRSHSKEHKSVTSHQLKHKRTHSNAHHEEVNVEYLDRESHEQKTSKRNDADIRRKADDKNSSNNLKSADLKKKDDNLENVREDREKRRHLHDEANRNGTHDSFGKKDSKSGKHVGDEKHYAEIRDKKQGGVDIRELSSSRREEDTTKSSKNAAAVASHSGGRIECDAKNRKEANTSQSSMAILDSSLDAIGKRHDQTSANKDDKAKDGAARRKSRKKSKKRSRLEEKKPAEKIGGSSNNGAPNEGKQGSTKHDDSVVDKQGNWEKISSRDKSARHSTDAGNEATKNSNSEKKKTLSSSNEHKSDGKNKSSKDGKIAERPCKDKGDQRTHSRNTDPHSLSSTNRDRRATESDSGATTAESRRVVLKSSETSRAEKHSARCDSRDKRGEKKRRRDSPSADRSTDKSRRNDTSPKSTTPSHRRRLKSKSSSAHRRVRSSASKKSLTEHSDASDGRDRSRRDSRSRRNKSRSSRGGAEKRRSLDGHHRSSENTSRDSSSTRKKRDDRSKRLRSHSPRAEEKRIVSETRKSHRDIPRSAEWQSHAVPSERTAATASGGTERGASESNGGASKAPAPPPEEVVWIDDAWDCVRQSLSQWQEKRSTLLGACLSTRKEVEYEHEKQRAERRRLRREKRRLERERRERERRAAGPPGEGVVDAVCISGDECEEFGFGFMQELLAARCSRGAGATAEKTSEERGKKKNKRVGETTEREQSGNVPQGKNGGEALSSQETVASSIAAVASSTPRERKKKKRRTTSTPDNESHRSNAEPTVDEGERPVRTMELLRITATFDDEPTAKSGEKPSGKISGKTGRKSTVISNETELSERTTRKEEEASTAVETSGMIHVDPAPGRKTMEKLMELNEQLRSRILLRSAGAAGIVEGEADPSHANPAAVVGEGLREDFYAEEGRRLSKAQGRDGQRAESASQDTHYADRWSGDIRFSAGSGNISDERFDRQLEGNSVLMVANMSAVESGLSRLDSSSSLDDGNRSRNPGVSVSGVKRKASAIDQEQDQAKHAAYDMGCGRDERRSSLNADIEKEMQDISNAKSHTGDSICTDLNSRDRSMHELDMFDSMDPEAADFQIGNRSLNRYDPRQNSHSQWGDEWIGSDTTHAQSQYVCSGFAVDSVCLYHDDLEEPATLDANRSLTQIERGNASQGSERMYNPWTDGEDLPPSSAYGARTEPGFVLDERRTKDLPGDESASLRFLNDSELSRSPGEELTNTADDDQYDRSSLMTTISFDPQSAQGGSAPEKLPTTGNTCGGSIVTDTSAFERNWYSQKRDETLSPSLNAEPLQKQQQASEKAFNATRDLAPPIVKLPDVTPELLSTLKSLFPVSASTGQALTTTAGLHGAHMSMPEHGQLVVDQKPDSKQSPLPHDSSAIDALSSSLSSLTSSLLTTLAAPVVLSSSTTASSLGQPLVKAAAAAVVNPLLGAISTPLSAAGGAAAITPSAMEIAQRLAEELMKFLPPATAEPPKQEIRLASGAVRPQPAGANTRAGAKEEAKKKRVTDRMGAARGTVSGKSWATRPFATSQKSLLASRQKALALKQKLSLTSSQTTTLPSSQMSSGEKSLKSSSISSQKPPLASSQKPATASAKKPQLLASQKTDKSKSGGKRASSDPYSPEYEAAYSPELDVESPSFGDTDYSPPNNLGGGRDEKKKIDGKEVKADQKDSSSDVDRWKNSTTAEIQDYVVEEVRTTLMPFFTKKRISKEEYKDVLRKAVPKICHSRTRDFSRARITIYVEAYVRKVQQLRKYLAKKSAAAAAAASAAQS